MNFTLKIMGTASAMPISHRNPSAQVLAVHGRLFLIDCGEGTQQQLRRAHLSFVKIEAIFISHIHGDHVFGLFGLLRSMSMYGRTGDLYIYGPQALGSILNFFASFFGDGMKYRYIFTPIKAKSPEIIHRSKHIQVSAFPLNHKIDCYGYRFDEILSDSSACHCEERAEVADCHTSLCSVRNDSNARHCEERSDAAISEAFDNSEISVANASWQAADAVGIVPKRHLKSYAYCSDTAPFAQLAEWVRGVDLLYHEATYPQAMEQNAVKYYHSCSIHAAKCALQAGVGRLIVGHYSAKIQDFNSYLAECQVIFPNTSLANEGDSIDF